METPIREQMIERIQLTARRLQVSTPLPAKLLNTKTDGELLAWVRRLAVLEFEQTRGERCGMEPTV